MDRIELEYFCAAAKAESVTKAAESLHISQPAVSMMIRKLENELDASLFDRTSNRISLNSAGEAALRHAERILKEMRTMEAAVKEAAGAVRSLRIVFCDPGVAWHTMPRLQLAYPDLEIRHELNDEDGCIKLLHDNDADVAVLPRKPAGRTFCSLPFLHDQVFLSVHKGSSLYTSSSASIRTLPAQPLLCPDIGGWFLTQIEKIARECNQGLTIVKNSFDTTAHLIRTTNMLTTVSALSQELRNDGQDRVLIPLADPELSIDYILVFKDMNRKKAELVSRAVHES